MTGRPPHGEGQNSGRLRQLWRRRRGAAGHPASPSEDARVAAATQTRLDAVSDELELPPVALTVENGVATLEGDVSDPVEAHIFQEAAAATPGVNTVVTRLHRTMPHLPVDTGGPHRPSHALRELVAASAAAGCEPIDDLEATRIVLQMFFRALPTADRQHLLSALPDDVREAAGTATGIEHALRVVPVDLRAMEDAVAAFVGIRRPIAHEAVVSILQTLHAVLPTDRRNVAALLPGDLADVWAATPAAAGPGPADPAPGKPS